MSNPTSNFNWQMPTASDLVTDLPADFETFGQAVDTSLADLKGGTTGQVLSKASNTDMDFTWVAADDTNAIQNTIVDAKGDLIAASAADTPARLAVGNNGETLVADSSTSTGLRYQGNFAAGKNKIINGDFFVNQRNFTSTTTDGDFTFDRFRARTSTGTSTFTAETFAVGASPSPYEFKNYLQIDVTGQTGASAFSLIQTAIEGVGTLAGQTATISFFAKASSGTPSITAQLDQEPVDSAAVNITGQKVQISTSWARYSVTINIPAITGATGNPANRLVLRLWLSAGSNFDVRTQTLGIQTGTFQIAGVQLEAGSVATAFQTATGTIQGELAACQRYYYRRNGVASSALAPFSPAYSTTGVATRVFNPQTMRVAPTSVDFSDLQLGDDVAGPSTVTSVSLDGTTSPWQSTVIVGVASGLTQYRSYVLRSNTTSSYIGFSAEL